VHAKSMDLDGSANLPGASSNQIKTKEKVN